MTHEPDLFRKLYQTKLRVDDTKTFQIFGVPIGNAKITRKVKFHSEAPLIKCHQQPYNSSFLSSLESSFYCINDNRYVLALVNGIE